MLLSLLDCILFKQLEGRWQGTGCDPGWYRAGLPHQHHDISGTYCNVLARFVQRLRRAEIRPLRPRGGHQNSPFRGKDNVIPYMVGKLAPNSSHFTRGLVKYVPGRDYFRAVLSQNGDSLLHTRPPPQSLNGRVG